jgi:hypothetical protein
LTSPPSKTPAAAGVGVAAKLMSRQSDAVVEVEFDRVRRHAQLQDFLAFEVDVAINRVIGENTADF